MSNYQQGYHRAVTASHATRTAEKEAAFILPYLTANAHVLDVGCGPGSISTGFTKYVPEGSVTGIDLTDEVLDQARELVSQQPSPPTNITFEIGNVLEGLKYRDASFDVIFCNQVLIHLPDPVKAFREMKRLCKPGGFVACRDSDMPFRWVPYYEGLQLYDKYLYEIIFGKSDRKHPMNPPHLTGYRGGSMSHVWAREAGFDPSKMKKQAGTEVYASDEERKRWYNTWVGRFQHGTREKLKERGATDEDIELVSRDLKAWAENVDGWFAILQGELICFV